MVYWLSMKHITSYYIKKDWRRYFVAQSTSPNVFNRDVQNSNPPSPIRTIELRERISPKKKKRIEREREIDWTN